MRISYIAFTLDGLVELPLGSLMVGFDLLPVWYLHIRKIQIIVTERLNRY